MTRHILLVRHGTTLGQDDALYIGHTDIDLDEEGERQAQRLHRELEHWPIGIAYCSDLSRCRQTARIAVGERDIDIVARRELRDVAMGAWEGRLRSEVAAAYPEEHVARARDVVGHRPPGGESIADAYARVVAAFETIVASTEANLLVVGHATVNRLLLCHILGMPVSNLCRLGQDHGCMNVILSNRTGYRVTLINFTPQSRAGDDLRRFP